MTIRIEPGQHPHAPSRNWRFQDVSIETVNGELQIVEDEEMSELREFIESIDTHDDPRGSFIEQIVDVALELHKSYAEMEYHPSSMPRKDLVLAGTGHVDRSGQVVPGEEWELEVSVIVID